MRDENILRYEMFGHWPEFLEGTPRWVIQGRDIVDKGIEPDIGHIVGIEGKGDSPGKPVLRTGDTEILQRFPKEGKDLISIDLRPNKILVFLNVVDQPILIFAHLKEIIFFLDELGLLLVIRAFPIHQFSLGIEAFATEAVISTVFPEIDVPFIIDFPQDQLNYLLVFFSCGANEGVVGDVQLGPEIFE